MKRHALFVGVDQYADENIQDLRCAVNDATEFAGFFKHRAHFDRAEALPNPRNCEAILDRVYDMISGLGVGDEFLFFFAGHGIKTQDGHRLVCAGDKLNAVKHSWAGLPIERIKSETSGAFNRLFLLDACRTDVLATNRGAAGGMEKGTRDLILGAATSADGDVGALTILCSCNDGECAGENLKHRHGLFSMAMLELLDEESRRGRRVLVTDDFVYNQIPARMRALAEKSDMAFNQKPQKEGPPILILDGKPSDSVVTDTSSFDGVVAPSLVKCPVCGRWRNKTETFDCRQCGCENICIDHQDEKTFLCASCTEKMLQELPEQHIVAQGLRKSSKEEMLQSGREFCEESNLNGLKTLPSYSTFVGHNKGDWLLDRYEVLAELGQGGMGTVYKCFDKVGSVEVAVKGLPPEVSHDKSYMKDIRDNFKFVSELRHPNIVGIRKLEVDPKSGYYYLVMDIANGMNLRRWARTRQGKEHLNGKLKIIQEIASALDYTHDRGIIHRDIKPENVMIDDSCHAHVLDFGLAAQICGSMSSANRVVCSQYGTPAYKAPEQWRGLPLNERTDQYSLGVLAYELIAGHLPFDAADISILQTCVLNENVAKISDVSVHINIALERALSKNPHDRFASCKEFVDALLEDRQSESLLSALPKTGDVKTLILPGGAEMEMIYCSPGEFMMGSPERDDLDSLWRSQDEILHNVRLTKGFWLGKYPVTQGQWQSVMGSNPAYFKGDWRLPVENVSWDDCKDFIEKVKSSAKLQFGGEARFPTEAEWEYACRAGTTTAYSWGDTLNGDRANCNGRYPYGTTSEGPYLKETTPIGRYDANAWGFFDMHGNVLEWCSDWSSNYSYGYVVDPVGPVSGSERVLRGGAWDCFAVSCRSASRARCCPIGRSKCYGFRICCSARQCG